MSGAEEGEKRFPPRVLSGIQPTGEMTIGNYLGAVRNWVALQDTDYECFYCVVDYHAITVEYDPKVLRRRTLEMTRDLLACGIDPGRSTLFVQSDVPEHVELAWIFAAQTAYGELSRMTQFKEKSEQHSFLSAGLFTYPILQAADILAYQATGVPVGEDQLQHLELVRDIARRFNQRFGTLFPETKALLNQAPRIMSPADPTRKMSKSLGPKHYIGVFEDEASILKKIRSHVTDVGATERTDDSGIPPGVANLLLLLDAAAPPEIAARFREDEKAGRLMYRDLKQAVADNLVELLRPIRERRETLTDDDVREVLRKGGERARTIARGVLDRARQRIGLIEV
jgi:tryptophanyl-tRNA synthetase